MTYKPWRLVTVKDCFEYGKEVGYGIGETNIADYDDYDTYVSDCLETEMDHFRQFSPFEFYANDMNAEEVEMSCASKNGIGYVRVVKQDPDRKWEEYDRGVVVGLNRAWRDFR